MLSNIIKQKGNEKMKLTAEEKQALVTRYYNGESVADICLQSGVARSTFYTWLKPHKTIQTEAGYEISPAEFAKLRTRVVKLEQEIDVLKRVNCTVSAPLKERLHALESLYGQYSVHVLCEALDVPRGTFYNHMLRNKKDNSSYQIRRTHLSEKIRRIYEGSNQIFGAKKIRAILAERGEAVSDKMVAELMAEMNLTSIRQDAKKNYNRSKLPRKKDILDMNFSVKAPNQVWVSDVTYFRLDNKFRFICVIIDLYSRKVVACNISKKHSTQLISSTFKMAYKNREPSEGLIFHSDRGTQYTANSFRKLLRSCSVKQSFSPSGSPHHNAVMESFFSSMKKEELYRANYHSARELEERVQHYVEFYNNERPHSTLGYKTPNKHEQLFYKRNVGK